MTQKEPQQAPRQIQPLATLDAAAASYCTPRELQQASNGISEWILLDSSNGRGYRFVLVSLVDSTIVHSSLVFRTDECNGKGNPDCLVPLFKIAALPEVLKIRIRHAGLRT